MKRKIIVAIGGGENGRILNDGSIAPYNTENIDKEIVNLTNKKNPNFLFLCHAINILEVQESYFNIMKNIYGNIFGCNCDILKIEELNDIELVKKKLEWADIIYEGGGNTKEMISLWQNTGFDKLLYDSWNDGKVICGISAGANCWFKSCNAECNDGFECLECLGWYDFYLTPHCNEEGRYKSSKEQLKDNGLIGIMLSNCCALEIVNNEFKIILSDEDAFAIKGRWQNGIFVEEELSSKNTYTDIKYLYN